jgi:flagellar biogenesis protein FliO
MVESGISLGDIFYLIISLSFVVGLIVLTLYWLKKSKILLSSKIGQKGYNIEILSTAVMAQNRYLSLVKVKDDILLLGISEGSITKLQHYKEQDFSEVKNEEKDN